MLLSAGLRDPRSLTLNGGCEIHGIEATGTEFLVGSFFPFTETVACVMLAPEIRASVSERNV